MKSMLGIILYALIFAVALVAGCSENPEGPPQAGPPPSVISLVVQPNEHNVLSAKVIVRTANAASVSIEYWNDSLATSETASVAVVDSVAEVPVLGLRPDQTYQLRAKAWAASGETATGDQTFFATDPLPDNLPDFTLIGSQSPTPGYVMIGVSGAGAGQWNAAVILDNLGHIVWYKEFLGAVIDFQQQFPGTYTVFSNIDSDLAFYELDRLGNVLGQYSTLQGEETGAHELRLYGGAHCLYGAEYRDSSLTAIGGQANAIVRGMTIEYIRNGQPNFFWNTFDHLQITDAVSDISITGVNVNPWHSNAIDVDNDGNLLVSFRNMDEITKISVQTGEIIWRLGGENNQFTFVNDPLNGFSHQHGIRRLPNGNIILFDNGNLHSPPVSRAVEYRLNESTMVAEMVWEYRHSPSLFGNIMGFAQRLENDNTVVCFGSAQRVVEVNSAGVVQWEVAVDNPGYNLYRAFRIESLY
ncbi:MAG: aryl-sulfate sulfotransferase [Bacteroidota bacterium]